MGGRELREIIVAILGIGLLISAPLALQGAPVLMMLVMALGVGLLLLRVWRQGRMYFGLRREVQAFHHLVRELNSAALALKEQDSAERRHRLEEVRSAMVQSVDRMVFAAGKTEEELEEAALGGQTGDRVHADPAHPDAGSARPDTLAG